VSSTWLHRNVAVERAQGRENDAHYDDGEQKGHVGVSMKKGTIALPVVAAMFAAGSAQLKKDGQL